MAITRCPECTTAFRVTQEQLDAREGKVRCGHCAEVFDALAFLEETDVPAAAVSAAPPAPEPAFVPPPALPLSRPQIPAEWIAAEEAHEKKRRSSGWWTVLALVLVLGLLAQLAFYLRGPIALMWPVAKPYLEAACAQLGCDIPLPRRAELVSIENSDLQTDPANPGVIVLTATLRNRAAFPQAFPALELTLTNERDQPLARRVLQPQDYLRAKRDEGFGASSELQVKLPLEAAALKASGYRLYLFYP